MSTATEALASFSATLELSRVPAVLVAKARDHLLDTIAVACAGIHEPDVVAVRSVMATWGGVPEAGVVGLPLGLPAPRAAFVNALHARIHTFDDTHEAGPSHPGNAVVFAALAC